MYRVKVRVADGQAALHSHGAQDECRCQSKETHGKPKEVTQPVLSQADQRHVVGVADEHRWAEKAGPQQVGEGQTRDQDNKHRGAGSVLLLVDSEDEERQQVPHHSSQKHDDTGCRLAILADDEGDIIGDAVAGSI